MLVGKFLFRYAWANLCLETVCPVSSSQLDILGQFLSRHIFASSYRAVHRIGESNRIGRAVVRCAAPRPESNQIESDRLRRARVLNLNESVALVLQIDANRPRGTAPRRAPKIIKSAAPRS